ncbi:MAG: T9SS type A sorting domain-containing protein [Bacteroidia bacterium]|nr:T9SS type A sorting domain-containing protein [Bacteroidia bacterium]
MNKLLLTTTIFSALSTTLLIAQVNQRNIPTHNTAPMAVAANIISYGYVASSTQTMDLTLNLTNTDGEYADSIAITFPIGISPTGTPNLTFPTRVSGGGLESYNGIVAGQTITWGANTNDFWGGVAGRNLNFKVDVTVGNITGNKTASFHVSGDGYYQFNFSGDANGTFIIAPKMVVDLRVIDFFVPPFSCFNGTNEIIEIWLRNDGKSTLTGATDLSYQINANPTITENITQNVAPNDTIKYVFNATANFSTLGAYTINGTAVNALDGDFSNNQLQVNSYSYPQNSIPYTTGFERAPSSELLNWYGEDNGSPNSWDTTTIDPLTGNLCMRMLETSATTCDDYLFSSCLALQAGKTYNLSYWKNMATGYTGSFGAYLGTGQNSTSIIKVLSSLDTVPSNSKWINDSINFTVASSGIYHLGFLALNYNQNVIALRLDDIRLTDVSGLVSIGKTVNNNEVTVYPNPAKNSVTVLSSNDLSTLELYNIMGQIVHYQVATELGKHTINVSNLCNGYYNLKLTNSKNNSTYKHIVVQN